MNPLPAFDPRTPFASFTALIDAALIPMADTITLRALTEAGPLVQIFGTIALALVALGIGRGLGAQAGAVGAFGATVVKAAFVTTILSAGSYAYWVRDAVLFAMPAFFSKLVGGTVGSGAGAYDALIGQVIVSGFTIMRDLPTLSPWKLVVALLYWPVCGAAIVAGYGIWLLGHMMAVFYVALGPVFISLVFFAATRSITAAWVGVTLSAVVLQGLSITLSTLLVGAQTGVIALVTTTGTGDVFVKLGLLLGAACIFGLCGWWAMLLPAVASSLCGGVHFRPNALIGATYGAIKSAAKMGARAALRSSAGQRAHDALLRQRSSSVSPLTPPGPSLSRSPSSAGAP